MRERRQGDATRPARGVLHLALLVARREYRRTVSRRGFVAGTALVPLGAIALLVLTNLILPGNSAGNGTAYSGSPVYLVNESTLALPSTPPPGMPVVVVSRAEATAMLRQKQAPEVYLLTSDWLRTGRIERLVLTASGTDLSSLDRRDAQQTMLAQYLRSALLHGSGLPPDVQARIVQPSTLTDLPIDGTAGSAPSSDNLSAATFLIPYAFSLLFILSIFITSGYLLQSVSEEKENRVVEIVLSSVPPLPLMAGKILGLGGAGLTQVAIWLVTALVALPIAGTRLPELGHFQLGPIVLALALVYFVLGYICYGAIFAAIGALAPATREAQQYSGFMGIFGAVPLIFTGAFLADPHSPLVTALTLIPLTAPGSALQVVALEAEIPWTLISSSLLLLGAFAVVATVASARIFRATLLLYGVRPSLRQVAAAVLARG